MAAYKKTEKLYCTMGDHFVTINKFWQSESPINKNGYLHICSDCINDLFDKFYKKFKNKPDDFIVNSNTIEFDLQTERALKETCRYIDLCFNYDAYQSLVTHVSSLVGTGRTVGKMFGIYKSKLSTVVKTNSGIGTTYEFSDEIKVHVEQEKEQEEYTKNDLKNKEDVIRLIGYDPFEYEKEEDKKYLYNTLIEYLDEATLKDSFKLPVCIEITKGFNQLRHINKLISDIDYNSADATGKIKSLTDVKKKLMDTLLDMAKDNGISVNHNNNKSKGANTLNGIVKQLEEIGLSTAEVNLFNLETCESMKQIADISNKSILEQLMFDENDYADMLAQQRIMIQDLSQEVAKLKEENRLLNIKLNKDIKIINID